MSPESGYRIWYEGELVGDPAAPCGDWLAAPGRSTWRSWSRWPPPICAIVAADPCLFHALADPCPCGVAGGASISNIMEAEIVVPQP
jgi:hypothetical protein